MGLRCSCQCREENSLNAAAFFSFPLTRPVVRPLFFIILLHKGKMRKSKNPRMKSKTWEKGERMGWGCLEAGVHRKERQSQKTRGLSKVRDESWSAVIFEKWSSCSAPLKSQVHIISSSRGHSVRGFGTKNSAMVSFFKFIVLHVVSDRRVLIHSERFLMQIWWNSEHSDLLYEVKLCLYI